ncbi:cytochrome b/b6 domain-containing protein [Pseudomonas aeruginosa]|nr:cytochrome b/b6 domain-containing protein [Pseudomonas aeruginosa]
MTHPATVYSLSTRLLHWSMAFCFIGAIVLAYFVIWCSATTTRSACRYSTCTALGLLVGLLLIPRIVSRLRGPRLPAVPGTPLEHRLAHYAHLSLYALMLVMPLTGYVGTRLPTDFGLFVVPSLPRTPRCSPGFRKPGT